MAMFNATVALYDGTITNTDQIAKLPISGKDKLVLLNKFHSNDRADDRDLNNGLNRLAGVPIGMNFVEIESPRARALQSNFLRSNQ